MLLTKNASFREGWTGNEFTVQTVPVLFFGQNPRGEAEFPHTPSASCSTSALLRCRGVEAVWVHPENEHSTTAVCTCDGECHDEKTCWRALTTQVPLGDFDPGCLVCARAAALRGDTDGRGNVSLEKLSHRVKELVTYNMEKSLPLILNWYSTAKFCFVH